MPGAIQCGGGDEREKIEHDFWVKAEFLPLLRISI
jgi:hypothetical protein